MTETLDVKLAVRWHGRWAMRFVKLGAWMRSRRLVTWAANRISVDYRIGDGRWQPLGHVRVTEAADGHLDAEWVPA